MCRLGSSTLAHEQKGTGFGGKAKNGEKPQYPHQQSHGTPDTRKLSLAAYKCAQDGLRCHCIVRCQHSQEFLEMAGNDM